MARPSRWRPVRQGDRLIVDGRSVAAWSCRATHRPPATGTRTSFPVANGSIPSAAKLVRSEVDRCRAPEAGGGGREQAFDAKPLRSRRRHHLQPLVCRRSLGEAAVRRRGRFGNRLRHRSRATQIRARAERMNDGASRNGRVVWITGASSGIGRALALDLARRGDRVAVSARGEDELRSLAEEAKRQHQAAFIPCPLDITEPGGRVRSDGGADLGRARSDRARRAQRRHASSRWRPRTFPVGDFERLIGINLVGTGQLSRSAVENE